MVVRYETGDQTFVEFVDPGVLVELTDSEAMAEGENDAAARLDRARATLRVSTS